MFVLLVDHNPKTNDFSIDVTLCNNYGKFVNDSPKLNANCQTKIVEVDDQPRLCLFAIKDIEPGIELRYDYDAPNLSWRLLGNKTCKPYKLSYEKLSCSEMVYLQSESLQDVLENCDEGVEEPLDKGVLMSTPVKSMDVSILPRFKKTSSDTCVTREEVSAETNVQTLCKSDKEAVSIDQSKPEIFPQAAILHPPKEATDSKSVHNVETPTDTDFHVDVVTKGKKKKQRAKKPSTKSKKPAASSNRCFCCPCCNKTYKAQLPRHLIRIHKWRKETALAAVGLFSLRNGTGNSSSKNEKTKKDYHHHHLCSFPNCYRVIKRRDHHLRFFHKLHGARYQKYLKNCRRFKKIPIKGSESFILNIADSLEKNEKTQSATKVKSKEENVEATLDDNSVDNPLPTLTLSPPTPSIDTPVSSPVCQSDDDCDENDSEEILDKELSSIMEAFQIYLMSLAGRQRKEQSAKGVVGDVKRYFKAIGGSKPCDIFRRDCLETYLDVYCSDKNFKGQTIKKYLRSLGDFFSYLIVRKIKVADISTSDILEIKTCTESYIKALRRKCGEDFWKLQNEHYDLLIDNEKMIIYHNSQKAKLAEQYLNEIREGEMTLMEANDLPIVRDHLLMLFFVNTGHRGGVAANMTLEEFSGAKKVEEYRIVSVKNHKTSDFYGPAAVPFDRSLYEKIQAYVKEVRSLVTQEYCCGGDPVFITTNGRKMTSGSISDRLNNIWKNLGLLKDGQRFCVNVVRKSVSTLIRETQKNCPETATLMGHSEATQKRHYVMKSKERDVVQAVSAIKEVMITTPTKAVKRNNVETTPGKTKRAKFTKEDCSMIEAHFSEEVSGRSPLTKLAIADVQQDSNFELSFEATNEQITDKIKHLRKKHTVVIPTQVDENDIPVVKQHENKYTLRGNDENEIPDVEQHENKQTQQKRKRKNIVRVSNYTMEEVDELREKCHELIVQGRFPPARIQSLLKGSILLRKHKMKAIRERLRYERRKFLERDSESD